MMTPHNLGDLTDRGLHFDRIAIIDLFGPSTPRMLTYRELDGLIGGVANRLHAAGLSRGARVAIMSLNRVEYIAAYLGIMRAGFTAVPVNIKLSAAVIAHVLKDSEVAFAFVDAARRPSVENIVPYIDFDERGAAGWAAQIVPKISETVTPGSDELAQILYTSGSTGIPKGVPLTHVGQLWALDKPLPAGAEAERQIVAQPFFHMNGLIVLKSVLRAGASLVVMPAFETRAYTDALARWQVTRVFAIPTMFARVIKEMEHRSDLDFSRLKGITLSSAPATLSLIERVAAAFPGVPVDVSYGSTEGGPSVFGPHADGRPKPPLALGVVVKGCEVKLVDGTDDEGVLMVRNPAVTPGYLNLPAKTAEVLSDGWYASGDVMRRDADGFYYFVGRADDMFICSGENIYPGEVEKMLEAHPAVAQALVVPLPDEERGQVPVAFIVPRAGHDVSFTELKAFAIANGPAYQHPRRVACLAEMPLAGTNKIDRSALVQMAREFERDQTWIS